MQNIGVGYTKPIQNQLLPLIVSFATVCLKKIKDYEENLEYD